MNVNDVAAQTVDPGVDPIDAIFARQSELMAKYHDVEAKNGTGYAFVKDVPVDLHDRRAQALLKDFAWRVTEEITETTLAFESLTHQREEAADALHFLVELMILADVKADRIRADHGTLHEAFAKAEGLTVSSAAYDLIEKLGEAMNLLKNKPWKTTQILTDVERFRRTISEAFPRFLTFAEACGFRSVDEILDLYLRKSEVNRFRIRSKY